MVITDLKNYKFAKLGKGVLELWSNGSGFLTSMENNLVYLGGSFLLDVCGVFGFPSLHHSNTPIRVLQYSG